MSSESAEGTIRSLSPLAIRVGWVSLERSSGAPRPHALIAFSWVLNALIVMSASRSAVRSFKRSTNDRPAALPAASRLKNRNSFGSARVNAARAMS